MIYNINNSLNEAITIHNPITFSILLFPFCLIKLKKKVINKISSTKSASPVPTYRLTETESPDPNNSLQKGYTLTCPRPDIIIVHATLTLKKECENSTSIEHDEHPYLCHRACHALIDDFVHYTLHQRTQARF